MKTQKIEHIPTVDDSLIEKSDIENCLKTDKVRLTVHIRKRMDQRNITTDELFHSLEDGEITERYPNDKPFPSCLVEGRTRRGKNLCVVCSLSPENILVLITAYEDEGE